MPTDDREKWDDKIFFSVYKKATAYRELRVQQQEVHLQEERIVAHVALARYSIGSM